MLVFFFLVVMVAVLVLMSVLIILMMVMMFVLMGMMVFLMRMRVSVGRAISRRVFVAMLVSEMNVEVDSFNGSFVSAGNVQVVPTEFELFQFVLQVVCVDSQIEQRADKHVAADSAENIQIQRLHRLNAFPCASSFIWLAAKPAPNPLSILTTVTPLLQLLSIASKAARPPKLAPDPILVGTAITGLETRPATRLGRTASIPQ